MTSSVHIYPLTTYSYVKINLNLRNVAQLKSDCQYVYALHMLYLMLMKMLFSMYVCLSTSRRVLCFYSV